MKRFKSFDELADVLEQTSFRVGVAPFEAAEIIAPVLAESVKEIFGHDPPLATLAKSTQIERARLGYTPNDPLVRTGSLRETVQPLAVLNLATAGSMDPVARYSEDGSADRPPRPTFLLGLQAAMPVAHTIVKNVVGEALGKRSGTIKP